MPRAAAGEAVWRQPKRTSGEAVREGVRREMPGEAYRIRQPAKRTSGNSRRRRQPKRAFGEGVRIRQLETKSGKSGRPARFIQNGTMK